MVVTKDGYRPTIHSVLDRVTGNLSMALRIPRYLVLRHHALRSAEIGGAITDGMVNAQDTVTCRGIPDASETNPCLVQGDSVTIDALRFDASSNAANPENRFLVCETMDGFEAFNSYARSFGDLFRAQMDSVRFTENHDLCLGSIRRKADEGYGLLILGPQAYSYRKHPFASTLHERVAEDLSICLLVVPEPRWPISKILVLIKGEENDCVAVEWGVRLAQASKAEISLLALVPPVPVLYQGLGRISSGLPELLSTETRLGQHLRWAAARLVAEGLDGAVRLGQGLQEWQIRHELLVQDHDLVVVGAEDQDWLRKTIFGANPCPLLQWADRPVLVAK